MHTPLAFGEIFDRKFRLMITCDQCRREAEILRQAIPAGLMSRLRRYWLDEVLASGRLRCRSCGGRAAKVLVRAVAATGREFTIEGYPVEKFGVLAELELDRRHRKTETAGS